MTVAGKLRKLLSRSTFAALAVLIAILALAGIASAISNKEAAKRGADWLEKRDIGGFTFPGTRADAINALAAARKQKLSVKDSSIEKFNKALKDQAVDYATTPGAAGKLILAAVAVGGERPRCYGPTGDKVDLVGVIKDSYSKGRYGKTSFDQAFAMLGLVAAGEKVPSKALSFVRSKREARGWSFALRTGPGDDIDSTAMIIEAMRAAGVSKNDKGLRAALKWIRYQRNSEGGFNPAGNGGETQANTTALAVRAARALGSSDSGARRALRKLQKKGGFFYSTAAAKGSPEVATPEAVIALSGESLPVRKRGKRDTSCVS